MPIYRPIRDRTRFSGHKSTYNHRRKILAQAHKFHCPFRLFQEDEHDAYR